jgi:hypothetical protein
MLFNNYVTTKRVYIMSWYLSILRSPESIHQPRRGWSVLLSSRSYPLTAPDTIPETMKR